MSTSDQASLSPCPTGLGCIARPRAPVRIHDDDTSSASSEEWLTPLSELSASNDGRRSTIGSQEDDNGNEDANESIEEERRRIGDDEVIIISSDDSEVFESDSEYAAEDENRCPELGPEVSADKAKLSSYDVKSEGSSGEGKCRPVMTGKEKTLTAKTATSSSPPSIYVGRKSFWRSIMTKSSATDTLGEADLHRYRRWVQTAKQAEHDGDFPRAERYYLRCTNLYGGDHGIVLRLLALALHTGVATLDDFPGRHVAATPILDKVPPQADVSVDDIAINDDNDVARIIVID